MQKIRFDSFESVHQLAPVRFNGIGFARKMHSTSKFDKTVLSKCVTHNAFRHDVVSPSGNASLSRILNSGSDLRMYIFQPSNSFK